MNPNKALWYILTNDAQVSATTTNIFQLRLPQGSTYPAITLQRISDVPYSDKDGNTFFDARIQVNSFAENYNDAQSLAGKVSNVLDRHAGGIINGINIVQIDLVNTTDLSEDFSEFDGIVQIAQDYMVHYLRGDS